MRMSSGAHSFQSLLIEILPHIEQTLCEQLWQNLYIYYAQPHRHYHTLTHLSQMFELFDTYASKLHHSNAVSLAIWYHDIIYDPTSSDNERRSADYFTQAYAEYLPTAFINDVESLIMMTEKHQLDDTASKTILEDAKYFLDMDLAILGKDWNHYANFARQVRLEYQHVPLTDYKKGRIAILQSFLERERLYFTDTFSVMLETQARDNINREIEQLNF